MNMNKYEKKNAFSMPTITQNSTVNASIVMTRQSILSKQLIEY